MRACVLVRVRVRVCLLIRVSMVNDNIYVPRSAMALPLASKQACIHTYIHTYIHRHTQRHTHTQRGTETHVSRNQGIVEGNKRARARALLVPNKYQHQRQNQHHLVRPSLPICMYVYIYIYIIYTCVCVCVCVCIQSTASLPNNKRKAEPSTLLPRCWPWLRTRAISAAIWPAGNRCC